MCVVSNVGDYWNKRWPEQYPWVDPIINPPQPAVTFPSKTITISNGPTQAEFDALKKEVLELRKLLEAAIEFDKNTNQPSCEQEEKIAMLKKIAELVGVDLSKVFK